MKINTRVGLKNLKGEFLHDQGVYYIMGEVLGGILVSNSSKDAGKSFKLGMEFYNKPELELKADTVVFIKEVITAANKVTPLVGGQIIGILEGEMPQELPPAEPPADFEKCATCGHVIEVSVEKTLPETK